MTPKTRLITKLPIVMGILHFILITLTAILVALTVSVEGSSPNIWFVFHWIDWPCSIVLFKLWENIPQTDSTFVNGVILPFFLFGFVGSYYWILIFQFACKVISAIIRLRK
jgi:hypothetical protein